MAFINSVKDILPGMGAPSVTVQRANVATNTGNTTVTLPATGSFAPAITTGRIRVKSLSMGVNSTTKVALITGTDGTNTVQLYAGDASATSVNVGVDEFFDFRTDLKLTSVSVIVNVATNNCTHDVEIAANP